MEKDTLPFRLVSNRDAQLHNFISQEFGAGSFENILLKQDFYRTRIINASGKFQVGLWEKAMAIVPKIIAKRQAIFCSDKFDWAAGFNLLKRIGINSSLTEFMVDSVNPDLPSENCKRYQDDLINLINWSMDRHYSREELEFELADNGIYLLGSDITRLLLYDLNKDHFSPQVMVIPNSYKPYKPSLALVEDGVKFTADQVKFLRMFMY